MADSYEVAAEFRAELRRFLRRSEDCSRANGITPRQHLLLLQIAGAPEGTTTVSDLVNTLSLTQSAVTELELDEAIDRASLGLERKSRVLSEAEKERTAVHEMGHALVGLSLLVVTGWSGSPIAAGRRSRRRAAPADPGCAGCRAT